MAEKQLDDMRVTPGKNGGATVRHSYKSQPVHRKGGPNSGMGMDYPSSEEFIFGAGDGDKFLAHIAKHAGFKGEAKEEAAEGKD